MIMALLKLSCLFRRIQSHAYIFIFMRYSVFGILLQHHANCELMTTNGCYSDPGLTWCATLSFTENTYYNTPNVQT